MTGVACISRIPTDRSGLGIHDYPESYAFAFFTRSVA
jgi:hypothetical protein